ncbi:MAG: endonuclease domain-containing protein, partial [Dehalococcoidia bacterium]|nr:endonuclease domain-containing protein [Dehalococcoidia bacterium]
VEFYCPKLKLVIEIDGDTHYSEEGKMYDEVRTGILQAYGLQVIRFNNMDVRDNFESVCHEIDRLIPPQPPLVRGARGIPSNRSVS